MNNDPDDGNASPDEGAIPEELRAWLHPDPDDDSFYDRVYPAPPSEWIIREHEDDTLLQKFRMREWAEQMFDPPYKGSISVAGVPILGGIFLPKSETKYRNFLDWWMKVGTLKPTDPQGWATLSGPWVMFRRVEAISREDWNALPRPERALILAWAHSLPVGLFYD